MTISLRYRLDEEQENLGPSGVTGNIIHLISPIAKIQRALLSLSLANKKGTFIGR